MAKKQLNIRVNQKGARRAEQEQRKLGRSVQDATKSFGAMKTILTGAFAIAIGRTIGHLVDVAGKAEGVERAFKRLNQPGLLSELRSATRNAVNDFELMKAAVRAENFQIPVENLGTLLKFAQIRAEETGEAVEYLTDSIVMGIGRKSVMILDNLGLSAIRVREEFKKTGDMAAAVANIAEEEMGEMGEAASTTATQVSSLSASFDNLTLVMGKWLLAKTDAKEYIGMLAEALGDAAKLLGGEDPRTSFFMRGAKEFDPSMLFTDIGKAARKAEAELEAFNARYAEYAQQQDNAAEKAKELAKFQKRYNDELIKTYGLQTQLTDWQADWGDVDRMTGRPDADLDNIMFNEKDYKTASELMEKLFEERRKMNKDTELDNKYMAQSLTNDLANAWRNSFYEGKMHSNEFFDSLKERVIENIIWTAIEGIIEAIINYYTGGSGGSWLTSVLNWVSGKQAGGYVEKDKPYVVGEQGMELFIPQQSGHVIPNNEINNYAGNTTVENKFYFQGITDKKFVRDVVIPEINKATKLGLT